ncbi:inositol monophosphatase family protein [Streptomyces hygroscopicus]|uniref:inositol monophosphatase family protein n=1 Tax=Streptomyces hygroscopicus TaxID=1912 RepID=UPI0036946A45
MGTTGTTQLLVVPPPRGPGTGHPGRSGAGRRLRDAARAPRRPASGGRALSEPAPERRHLALLRPPAAHRARAARRCPRAPYVRATHRDGATDRPSARWSGPTSARCAPDTPRAAGRLDGYYEADLRPWDHAAGALIAQEAGTWVGVPPGHNPAAR